MGSLVISVSGLPASVPARISVTGPTETVEVRGTTTLSLFPGEYEIVAHDVVDGAVTYWGVDGNRLVVVNRGQTTSISVGYQLATPQVRVFSSGLPAGVQAPWSLGTSAPGDFGSALLSSGTIAPSAFGTYLIRAGGILSGGQILTPVPALQSFVLAPGTILQVSATWTAVQPPSFAPLLALGPARPTGHLLTGLAASTGEGRLFRTVVPPGATRLRIFTSGGTGNADLYCRASLPPAFPSGITRFGETPGNLEECVVDNPAGGDWYALIIARTSYSGLTLDAEVTNPPATFPLTVAATGTGSGVLAVQGAGGQGLITSCTIVQGIAQAGCSNIPIPSGSSVVLAPTSGMVEAWGSDCAGIPSTQNCQIAMNQARQALVTFAPSLTIVGGGPGTGSGTAAVRVNGQLLSTCEISLGQAGPGCVNLAIRTGSNVLLQRTGGTLIAWGGACSGNQDCQFIMNQPTLVSASFLLPPPAIGVITTAFTTGQGFRYPIEETFVFPVSNTGGGTLNLNPPAVSFLDGTNGWLSATLQPGGFNVKVDLKSANGVVQNQQELSGKVTLSAAGAESKDVRVTLKRLITSGGTGFVASRRVIFHWDPNAPLPGDQPLTARVKFAAPGGTPAGLRIENVDPPLPANPDFLAAPTIISDEVQLQTRAQLPALEVGGPVYVLVRSDKQECRNRNPECTIEVRLTRNQDPEARLDPWGLTFVPPERTKEVKVSFYNEGINGNEYIWLRLFEADPPFSCPFLESSRITKDLALPGNPATVEVTINSAGQPSNQVAECTLRLTYSMHREGEQIGIRTRDLLVQVLMPPDDDITLEYGDLTLTASRNDPLRQQEVKLRNFGIGTITGLSALLVPPASDPCPNGVVTPVLSGSLLPDGEAMLRVDLDPSRGTPGMCRARVQIQGFGAPPAVFTKFLDVTVFLSP